MKLFFKELINFFAETFLWGWVLLLAGIVGVTPFILTGIIVVWLLKSCGVVS